MRIESQSLSSANVAQNPQEPLHQPLDANPVDSLSSYSFCAPCDLIQGLLQRIWSVFTGFTSWICSFFCQAQGNSSTGTPPLENTTTNTGQASGGGQAPLSLVEIVVATEVESESESEEEIDLASSAGKSSTMVVHDEEEIRSLAAASQQQIERLFDVQVSQTETPLPTPPYVELSRFYKLFERGYDSDTLMDVYQKLQPQIQSALILEFTLTQTPAKSKNGFPREGQDFEELLRLNSKKAGAIVLDLMRCQPAYYQSASDGPIQAGTPREKLEGFHRMLVTFAGLFAKQRITLQSIVVLEKTPPVTNGTKTVKLSNERVIGDYTAAVRYACAVLTSSAPKTIQEIEDDYKNYIASSSDETRVKWKETFVNTLRPINKDQSKLAVFLGDFAVVVDNVLNPSYPKLRDLYKLLNDNNKDTKDFIEAYKQLPAQLKKALEHEFEHPTLNSQVLRIGVSFEGLLKLDPIKASEILQDLMRCQPCHYLPDLGADGVLRDKTANERLTRFKDMLDVFIKLLTDKKMHLQAGVFIEKLTLAPIADANTLVHNDPAVIGLYTSLLQKYFLYLDTTQIKKAYNHYINHCLNPLEKVEWDEGIIFQNVLKDLLTNESKLGMFLQDLSITIDTILHPEE